eukprot:gene10685-3250_t
MGNCGSKKGDSAGKSGGSSGSQRTEKSSKKNSKRRENNTANPNQGKSINEALALVKQGIQAIEADKESGTFKRITASQLEAYQRLLFKFEDDYYTDCWL